MFEIMFIWLAGRWHRKANHRQSPRECSASERGIATFDLKPQTP
jgi:hypothetical protein